MPKVKVIKRYSDIILHEIKEKGEVFETTEERAKHLEKEGAAVILKGSKMKEAENFNIKS